MMSLPRSCQNEGCKEAGRGKPLPPLVSAPESALGSHSCVALSSAQANARIQQSTRPSGQNSAKLSSRFLRDATILISSRFLLDATGRLPQDERLCVVTKGHLYGVRTFPSHHRLWHNPRRKCKAIPDERSPSCRKCDHAPSLQPANLQLRSEPRSWSSVLSSGRLAPTTASSSRLRPPPTLRTVRRRSCWTCQVRTHRT